MRSDLLQLVFLFLALAAGAGCEELLPKVLGIGCPVLLTLTLLQSVRGSRTTAVAFAVAAGALEDALCSLTPMVSVSYFLMAAALVRRTGHPAVFVLLAYPAYQLWLVLWTAHLNVFSRVLLSVPVGGLTAACVAFLFSSCLRKAGLDEHP